MTDINNEINDEINKLELKKPEIDNLESYAEVEEDTKSGKKIIRYSKNPFVEKEGIILDLKKKQVRIGSDSQVSLINHSTEEISSTHLMTYQKVDASEFIKIMMHEIAAMCELSSQGVKMLSALCWSMNRNSVINKDIVRMDQYEYEDYMEYLKEIDKEKPLKKGDGSPKSRTFSAPVWAAGLKNLENCKIIAKNKRKGHYYINPNFIFNGDRVAFTKVYEKEKRKEEIKQMEQTDQKNQPVEDFDDQGE